ncbi:sodium/potassium-transporting ATPase subunit beta-1-like isoform X1 [Macrobrachium nipponense]|uniref:sodium/potassium-transporting ATPase subunit beta-1-like isoform X1 n=1 Tax=Macrobrachium nipponense TaxID=159736 RepID=UPI0030C7A572
MAGTEMDKEVEYEGLEVPHSEGKPLRKKKAYMIAVVVASTSIIILLIILIIFINKMSQNDINVNEGFQAVLPQKKICFDPADPSTYEEYVKVYNKTIEPYERSKIEGNRINCAEADPKEDEVCHFADTWLNNCKKGNLWGFKSSRPCILLTVNRNMSFIPEPFSSSGDLPDGMPEDLKEEIKASGDLNELIGVHCSHASEYDPLPGFTKNFIINKNRTDFLPPLVGVTFDLQDIDHLDVECTLWSNTTSVNPFPKVYFKIGKQC